MRKYYTRPCNFYYGNYAKKLVSKKKAYPLAGNSIIAFDQLEIFQRKKKGKTSSNIYSIHEVKDLNKKIKNSINIDLKKIISKRFFQNSINPLHFLFFTKLNTVFREFSAPLTMLSRRICSFFNSAFYCLATGTF